MSLPFSHAQFLDVFGHYNRALLPFVVALWAATAALLATWMLRRRAPSRPLSLLLAVHWAWSGVVYHGLFFRAINPAATLFAGLFCVQAILFAGLAVRGEAAYSLGRSPRGLVAGGLLAYGMAYPALGWAFGLEYPRMPLFAVPCPTTILTAGLLLAASGVPWYAGVAPALWAAIGAYAAVELGVQADWALMPSGLLLLVDMTRPAWLGRR